MRAATRGSQLRRELLRRRLRSLLAAPLLVADALVRQVEDLPGANGRQGVRVGLFEAAQDVARAAGLDDRAFEGDGEAVGVDPVGSRVCAPAGRAIGAAGSRVLCQEAAQLWRRRSTPGDSCRPEEGPGTRGTHLWRGGPPTRRPGRTDSWRCAGPCAASRKLRGVRASSRVRAGRIGNPVPERDDKEQQGRGGGLQRPRRPPGDDQGDALGGDRDSEGEEVVEEALVRPAVDQGEEDRQREEREQHRLRPGSESAAAPRQSRAKPAT